MKKRIFDLRLYINGLKQLRVAGVLMLVLSLACTLLPALLMVHVTRTDSLTSVRSYAAASYTSAPLSSTTTLLALIMYLAPVIFAMTLFSFLNTRRGSDFYHSLSYTRPCLYLSFAAAAVTWLAAIVALPLCCTAVVYLATGTAFGCSFGLLLLTYFCGALLVTAAMLIAKSVTGTALTNLTVGGLILFLPRLVTTMFAYLLISDYPILTMNNFGLFGNLNYNIPVDFIFSMFVHSTTLSSGGNLYASVPAVVYTLVLALLYFALAGLFFTLRKSETAGRSAPNRALQHVYRCAVTLPFTLFIPVTLVSSEKNYWAENRSTLIVSVVVSLLVYFIYELLSTKKLKNLLTAAPFLLAVAVADAAICGSVFVARTGALSFRPAAADIASVSIVRGTSNTGTVDYAELSVRKVRFTDEAFRKQVADALSESLDTLKEGGSIRPQGVFRITLRSGKTVERAIYFQGVELFSLRGEISSNADFVRAATSLPPVNKVQTVTVGNLSAAESRKVWQAYAADYDKLNFPQKQKLLDASGLFYGLLTDGNSSSDSENVCETIQCSGNLGTQSYYNTSSLTVDTPDALRLCAGYENAESRQALDSFISSLSDDSQNYLTYTVNLYNPSAEDLDIVSVFPTGDESRAAVTIASYSGSGNSMRDADRDIFSILKKQADEPLDITKPFVKIQFTNKSDSRIYYCPVSAENLRAIMDAQH